MQIDPESSAAHVVLGLCLGSWGGNLCEGIKYLKHVLAASPNDWDASYWFNSLYAHLGKFREANFYMDKFRSIDPLSCWNLIWPDQQCPWRS